MKGAKDIERFVDGLANKFVGHELTYRSFKEGDFGTLDQVEFNSKKIGGNIDFWGLGWLGVFIWDYEAEKQLLNVLLEPHQEKEKSEVIEQLEYILQKHQ